MRKNKQPEVKYVHIPISHARPGMVVAKDVYTRSNQVILNAGTVLDAHSISRIMFYSIDSVFVLPFEEEHTDSLVGQVQDSFDFREFTKRYDEAVDEVKATMEMIISGKKEICQDKLIEKIENIIMTSNSKGGIFTMLHCIRSYDEVTYMHSVNVALIGNCFGKWLSMSEEDQRILTLSGLLHDIGKTCIPKEILLKPDSLTQAEYEIVKTHTLRGYDTLRDKKIDDRVKLVALQHHERSDRSGYPYGKSAEDLEPFSMIIAIADVYDAMTSDRVYRPGICAFDVIKSFEDNGLTKYNPKYLMPLLEQISNVYINHTVRLTDDSVGKVVLMNNRNLSRPVVQIDDIFVDLAKNRDLKITEVL